MECPARRSAGRASVFSRWRNAAPTQSDHRQAAHIMVQMILIPSRCFSQILLRRDAEVDIQMIICIYHDLVNQHGNDGALGFP